MCSPLPYKDIKFCTGEETFAIAQEFILYGGTHLDDEGETGYILEVCVY